MQHRYREAVYRITISSSTRHRRSAFMDSEKGLCKSTSIVLDKKGEKWLAGISINDANIRQFISSQIFWQIHLARAAHSRLMRARALRE